MSEKDDIFDKNYIDGICCSLCGFYETDQCVVESASSWSRHASFCSEFIGRGSGLNIRETFIKRLQVM